MKVCTRCKEEKPESEFYSDKSCGDGLQSRCKKCTNDASIEWRKNNPKKAKESSRKHYYKDHERTIQYQREYRSRHPMRIAYWRQKSQADQRGIAWHFTFESWCEWWGEDFANRGREENNLCMARKNDEGHYSPDNCVKATMRENWERLV